MGEQSPPSYDDYMRGRESPKAEVPKVHQIQGFVLILPANPKIEGDKELYLSKGFQGDYWTDDVQFARLFPTHETLHAVVNQINGRGVEDFKGRWVTIEL